MNRWAIVLLGMVVMISIGGCDGTGAETPDGVATQSTTTKVDLSTTTESQTPTSGVCPNNECGLGTQWPGDSGNGGGDDGDDDSDDCPNHECGVNSEWPKGGPKTK